MTEQKPIYQGDELKKNSHFIAIVCDIDDIKGRAEENEIELSPEQLQKAYDHARAHMTDQLMEDFWVAVDDAISEVEEVIA